WSRVSCTIDMSRSGAWKSVLRWRGPGTASNLHHLLGFMISLPLALVSLNRHLSRLSASGPCVAAHRVPVRDISRNIHGHRPDGLAAAPFAAGSVQARDRRHASTRSGRMKKTDIIAGLSARIASIAGLAAR